MNSIKRTLLLWLSIGIAAGILVAAFLIYFQSRNEANQIFDYQMKQLVASLPAQAFAPLEPSQGDGDERADAQRDVEIQIWDNNGLRIYHSHRNTALPARAELGFANITARGIDWRVYSAQLGNTIVQVAQPTSARLQLAAKMALKTIAPLLLLLPLLAILIWVTVDRGLASITQAAKAVQSRDAALLTPISDIGVPQEIRPLTMELNHLLRRLDVAMGIQRTFVADAAHELKTPLTALNLQIQLAERASSEEEKKSAFSELKQGLARATRLVHQLLTLARQEPGTTEQKMEALDLSVLAHSVVSDFALLENSKNIDLGCNATHPVFITGNADALRILLSNLIDNAIRYCPDGSHVDVAVERDDHSARLIVRDTGPGIPESDLLRVFDRFYRVPGTQSSGSGLGLAIVKQIALLHGANLSMRNGNGLCVCVKFACTH